MKAKKTLWDNNHIQFARLISELASLGVPNSKHLKQLCESTDLSVEEIENIFDRAAVEWERAKRCQPVRKHTPEIDVRRWRKHA